MNGKAIENKPMKALFVERIQLSNFFPHEKGENSMSNQRKEEKSVFKGKKVHFLRNSKEI